ncbi:MAG: 8-oxo-dGTP diphosphatase MutT [Cyanobacteria bacterium P01_G01_bin.19]
MSGTSPPKAHKQIGVAVITNPEGKVLIDRRKPTGDMGGLWEFPGGKIESGETVVECIQREIKEELNIEISVGDRLTTITHDYENFKVTLHVHLCQHLSGDPQPIECEEIHWVDISIMNQYQFPRANTEIINLLQQRGINK